MSSSCLHAIKFCLVGFIELWLSETSVEAMKTQILTVVIMSMYHVANSTELSGTSLS